MSECNDSGTCEVSSEIADNSQDTTDGFDDFIFEDANENEFAKIEKDETGGFEESVFEDADCKTLLIEQDADKAETNDTVHITCRNEHLDSCTHPETDVPFSSKTVEIDGEHYEVVTPDFESSFNAILPDNMLKATDREQFSHCNSRLAEAVENDAVLRSIFDEEQLGQIKDGETPDGYTWHHDAEVGKMQLVDTELHQKTGHTGGRSIWGGGTDSR